MKTKYLQLESIKIAYCEYGCGPHLLLLHHNSGDKKLFKAYQKKHFKDFHTYAIDSRGHGQSISSDMDYSINQFSDDIIAFCDALGIEKAFVIGFSDGGNICLFLAKKRPELFEKIVAISPNYLVSGTKDGSLKGLTYMYKLLVFLKKLHLPVTKVIMRWELMLKDIGITDDEMKVITANVFILYADNDMIKEEHILSIAKLITNSKVLRIKNSTHLSICTKTESIKALLDYFN